jgi:hypothetical protein
MGNPGSVVFCQHTEGPEDSKNTKRELSIPVERHNDNSGLHLRGL